MTRQAAIIAAITLNLLAFPIAHAEGEDGGGFATYRVQLEVARNGVPVCAQDATVAAGEPLEVALLDAASIGDVRVLQRVTHFPGAGDSRALVEVELYGNQDGRMRRVVAPTLGVALGRAETYEVRTGQGLVQIRARVDGGAELPPPDPDAVLFETHALGDL